MTEIRNQGNITDGERTYSAFLLTADLSKILMTAMDQQAQPTKNFGVVTVTGPVVQQLQQASGLPQQKPGNSAPISSVSPQQMLQQSSNQMSLNHQNGLQQQQHSSMNTNHCGNEVGRLINKMRASNSLDSDSSTAADFNLVEQVIQHSTKIDPTTGILSQPLSSSASFTHLSNQSISNPANVQHPTVAPQQCFICPNGPWFKDDKDLNHHISIAHLDIDVKPNIEGENSSNLEVLSVADLEASFLPESPSDGAMSSSDFHPMVKDLFDDKLSTNSSSGFPDLVQNPIMTNGFNSNMALSKQSSSSDAVVASLAQGSNLTSSNKSTARTTTTSAAAGRGGLPTGRPCEICGFEPKTKNKSRERQDHLAMKHYRERIQSDLTEVTNFQCPLCDYVGKDKQTIYRHYTGKHKVVEQYLADDIRDGKVIPLSPEQMKNAQLHLAIAKDSKQNPRSSINSEGNIPNLPTAVETLPSIPDFSDAACLDLDSTFEPNSVAASGTSSNGSNGLGLTIHSLVDSSRLSIGDFMESEQLSCVQDRIMQVDGAFDDEITDEQTDDENEDDALIRQLDGALGDEEMSSEPDGFDEDSSNLSASSGSGDSRCPICDEPTKMHKTYHLATKHFKERLLTELPRDKPFKCPECEHESKTKINMWTHYLGKHRYGAKWMAEILEQKKNGKEMIAPPPKLGQTSFEPGHFKQQFPPQQGPTQQVPPQTTYLPQQQQHFYQQSNMNQPYKPPFGHQQQYPQHNTFPQHQILPPQNYNMGAPPQNHMAPHPNSNPSSILMNNGQAHIAAIPPQSSSTNMRQQQATHSNVGLPNNSICDNVVVNHPPIVPSSTELPPNNSKTTDLPPSMQASRVDVKVEQDVKPTMVSLQTPTTPLSSSTKKVEKVSKETSVASRRDNTFWCDLCQAVVNMSKINHFVSTHFQERLRKILPAKPPFHCPSCRYEGKHFSSLSTHFLKQHNVMDSWIRQALEQLEDEAMAKAHEREAKGLALDGSEDHKGSKHYISSGEEVDTSVSSN